MAAPLLRPLSLGETLDVGFGLYRHAFVPLVTIAVVTSGIPQVVNILLEAQGGSFAFWLVNLLLSLVLGTIGVGATTFVVSERYLGGTIPAAAAFGRATPYFGRILLLSVLAGLAIMAGLILLVIPGIIIAAGILLAVPALMLENLPSATRALSRSWELTRGLRGKALLTAFVAGCLLIIPTLAIGVLAAMMGVDPGEPGAASTPFDLIAVILVTLLSPYVYVVITVLYYDARVRKEAFDLEMLEAELRPA